MDEYAFETVGEMDSLTAYLSTQTLDDGYKALIKRCGQSLKEDPVYGLRFEKRDGGPSKISKLGPWEEVSDYLEENPPSEDSSLIVVGCGSNLFKITEVEE